MADVFDPNMTPEEFAIRQALQRAAALRNQPAQPAGQMIGDRYVAAPKAAALLPILNGLAADSISGKAIEQQQALTDTQRSALNDWLAARPTAKTTYGASDAGPTMTTTQPTSADTTAWAAQGLKNPLARSLAQKVIEDDVVQEPIRREKAQDKKDLASQVDQRYAEDRKARAALAEQNSKNRLDYLTTQLAANKDNVTAQLAIRKQIADEQNALRRYQIDAGIQNNEANRDQKADQFDRKLQNAAAKGMNPTQLKEIAGFQDEYRQHTEYGNTFKDNFAGPKAAIQAQLGGTFLNSDDPEAAEVAEWWRNFRAGDNVIRHGLYGSALTATEAAAWRATTVSPLSSPKQIRDAIATRARIAQERLDSRLALYGKGTLDSGAPTAAPAAAANPAPPTTATNFPKTRVTPGEQATRNEEQANVLLSEIRSGTNVANQSDYDGLVRELKRTGYKGAIPAMKIGAPGAAPAAATPKTLKWGDLK